MRGFWRGLCALLHVTTSTPRTIPVSGKGSDWEPKQRPAPIILLQGMLMALAGAEAVYLNPIRIVGYQDGDK